MKNFVRVLSVVLLAFCCAGCIFIPRNHVQTTYYDLQSPQKLKNSQRLMVAAVDNDTPAQSRMLFRFAGNRMVQDGSNCWVQVPERMMQRYLEQTFALPGNTDLSRIAMLRCTITAFEFDMVKSEAVLAMKYSMHCNHHRAASSVTVKEKLTGRTPDELALAMSRAAAKAAEEISRTAEKFAH